MADVGVGVDKTLIFLMHPEKLRKRAQQSNSRQLSCSNASRCVFVHK